MAAIDAIPSGAAPGPDGIPAIMMKKAKRTLSRILCDIFQGSLETGKIPQALKDALIVPIFKGGSRGKAANYRPISLTSHIMKTFERIMRQNLVSYMEYFEKLDPRQHGSRSGRSTLSQLLQHQDDVLRSLEDGDNVDVIYLDFAKAYDKVDHGILIHKLKKIGITGWIGRWIQAFLTGRRQQVLVRGRRSRSSPLISGVPQGSVLGPLLFLIYIGDISDGVSSTILTYVDDSKSSMRIKEEGDVERHQEELNKIYSWETRNNMRFNGGKFLVLRYGRNQEVKENTMYFTSDMVQVIEQVNTCRDLGVIMADDATFTAQIDKVCKRVKQKCGWILRTFYCRKPQFLRQMFNTLVQPHIDYCSQLYAPAEGPQFDRIEGLLRSFTSNIPQVKHLNFWDRLKELRMNSELRRIERYKIIYTWKILENLAPNCGISEANESERRGRRCAIPQLKLQVRKLREASFQVSGPSLFNKIPKNLRNLTKCGQEEFKTQLDMFLTSIPDEPRAPGLVPAAVTPDCKPSNSLLYQIDRARREGLTPQETQEN